MMGVRYQNDNRAKFLMSGSPGIKLGMWIVFNVLPFFLPNSVVLAYGYLARMGSVVFLFIQMLLLLDFVLTLNESWVAAAEDDDRHYQAMFGVSAGCYAACLAMICAHRLTLNWWMCPADMPGSLKQPKLPKEAIHELPTNYRDVCLPGNGHTSTLC